MHIDMYVYRLLLVTVGHGVPLIASPVAAAQQARKPLLPGGLRHGGRGPRAEASGPAASVGGHAGTKGPGAPPLGRGFLAFLLLLSLLLLILLSLLLLLFSNFMLIELRNTYMTTWCHPIADFGTCWVSNECPSKSVLCARSGLGPSTVYSRVHGRKLVSLVKALLGASPMGMWQARVLDTCAFCCAAIGLLKWRWTKSRSPQ